jgi:hypothetical protein
VFDHYLIESELPSTFYLGFKSDQKVAFYAFILSSVMQFLWVCFSDCLSLTRYRTLFLMSIYAKMEEKKRIKPINDCAFLSNKKLRGRFLVGL